MLAHTCAETIFRRTELAPDGECRRCDQLRTHHVAIVAQGGHRTRYCGDCIELDTIDQAAAARSRMAIDIKGAPSHA